MCPIESKSLWFLVNTHVKLFLHEQSMRWWLWLFFMKIYFLMPFDTFNGSLVEQYLILGCRSEISDTFTHSRKREGKITKMGQRVVTGLTGDRHRSDRCQRSQKLERVTRHKCPGDPVRLWMLQGDPAWVPGWPGVVQTLKMKGDMASKVMRSWTHDNYQIICVLWPSFGMSLNMFLIEQSALVEKFKFSSTT
jgi:hypothetical protein